MGWEHSVIKGGQILQNNLIVLLTVLSLTTVVTGVEAQTINVDFDSNGKVDFTDFIAFAQAFGTTQSLYDLNGNGRVDFPDFLIFVQGFSNSGGSIEPEKEITIDLPGGGTMAFTYIEPGTFMMGSNTTAQFREDENPMHEVTLTHGFYMGTYEVTQAQWETVTGTTPWKGLDVTVEDPQNPAGYITWFAAHNFIHQLNVAAGDSLYRLPTEAEWEYACRAGTTTEYFWGNDESQLETYAFLGSRESPYIPVGSKQANPWGLYDMTGNISEWCLDKHGVYPAEPQTDPLDQTISTLDRVRRSGYPISRRSGYWPGSVIYFLGFRVVRIIP